MPPEELEQLNRLIAALKRGDGSALDGILLLAGRRMFALARGIVRNTADAEDVVQECFLKIARAAGSFREGTNGYAWIMRIARNTALDFLRRNKRTATEDIDACFRLTDDRYSAERREEALALEEALSKLTEGERRLIYLRYYLDLTVREIAGETGMSKSAAARELKKAEEALKGELRMGQKGE